MRSISRKIPDGPPFRVETYGSADLFEAAAKLMWAREAIRYTSNWWEAHVDRHYKAATGDQSVKLPYDIEEHLLMPPVSVNLPLAVGDCIRNLRTSLDYLMSALARHTHLGQKAKILFPFAENPLDLERNFKFSPSGRKVGRREKEFRPLAKAYPKLAPLILDKIQPFSAKYGANKGGDLLWRLITSDSIEKHEMMTIAGQRTSDVNFRTTNHVDFRGMEIIGSRTFRFPPGVRLVPDSNIEVDLFFRRAPRLEGWSVIATLDDGAKMVDDVIHIFAKEFPILATSHPL